MNAKQEAPERQEIEELLPWHAAGTLSRRDAQRVHRRGRVVAEEDRVCAAQHAEQVDRGPVVAGRVPRVTA